MDEFPSLSVHKYTRFMSGVQSYSVNSNYENTMLPASESDDDDDEVMYDKNSHYERSTNNDVPPLNLSVVSTRGRFSKYKTALTQLAPVKPFQGHEASRIDQAGCFSFITYSWIFPYLWSTYRGLIPADQQWTCSTYDSASVNVTRLEYLWTAELRSKKNTKGPSLVRVVMSFMKTRLILSCFVFLFCLLFGFIGPSCLVRALIVYTETTVEEKKTLSRGLSIVFGLTAVELLRVLSYGATWAISYRTAIRVRCAILGLLYKKLLVARGLSSKGMGNIVNSFSNDGQRIFDAVTFLPLVIMGPLVLVGGLVYLLWLMGPWSLMGLLVFVVFDVFQISLGKTMVKFRRQAIEKSNERVKLISEIVQCIKTIKMNAWEYPFIDKVCDVRKEEKRYLTKAGFAQSLAIAAGPVVPVVAAAITFSAYILAGNDLSASTAFSAVTVFFVMVFGIRMIPYGMRYCAEALVSLRAIQVYLLLPEIDCTQLPPSNRNDAIEVKDGSFLWENVQDQKAVKKDTELNLLSAEGVLTTTILKNVNVTLKKKQLIGICGPVGSGKSSLLQAICGEMIQKHGTVLVGGSIAYAAQDAWILNTTFRENILFGESFDNKLYYKVVYACNLNPDINTMPAGDQTEVGERGATLSGGQKSRLALARVLYSNRDVFLLDDILVSLDNTVSRHVFDVAIRGFLVDKSVLLVTNNFQYLEQCDEIIFMKSGKTVDHGRHQDVLLRCDEYAEFCNSSKTKHTMMKPIENVFDTTEDGSQVNGTVNRTESEVQLSQNKEEARLRSRSHLSSAESVYDIPGAVSAQLMEPEEDFGLASVSKNVYKTYIFSMGGYCTLILLLFAFLANVGSMLFSTVWLAYWLRSLRQMDLNSTTNETQADMIRTQNVSFYAGIYFSSILFLIITSMFKAILFVKVSLRASNELHNKTFHKLMHGTMRWFDLTPLGRIVNRFSKDVDELDVKIPFSAETFVQNIFQIGGYLLIIAIVFPWFLIACVPLGVLFFVFVACFRSGIRCLKRAENISRSPMFSHIECSLSGASTIRSFGRTKYFTEKFKHLLDNNSGCTFMYQSAMRWLAVWLDLIVVLVTFATSLLIVLLSNSVEPAYAGMAVAFAIQMSGIFQFAVRMHAEVESKLTSVERLDYYIKNIEQDPDWYNPRNPVSFDWPQYGRISVRDVQLKYRESLAPALKGVSFEVKAEEKLGIIGRTGSGKSSIGAALFRLYPLTSGSISIDGMDIQPIGLHELRLKMAAIPQDPILFAGTVRFNLDPMKRHDDAKLWEALEKTHLKPLVTSLDKGLDSDIHEGGKNLSVGQRQLLCLARALLRNVKILLLDEATASLDEQTDDLVRQCLFETFKNCTLLIIAHRISSVYHSNKILLMDNGKVLEFDETNSLMQDSSSRLRRILDIAQKDCSTIIET